MINIIMMLMGIIALIILIVIALTGDVAAGWECEIRFAANKGALSGASGILYKGFSFEHKNNIEKITSGGTREIQENKELLIDIISSIQREYDGWTLLPTYAGVGSTGALTEYAIGIYPTGYNVGDRKIEALVKVGNWKIDVKDGAVDGESSDLFLRSVDVGTVS